MNKEANEWADVFLKDGTYMPYKISRDGVLVSNKTGKIMKGTPNTNGRLVVTLRDGKIKKVDYIHRIVYRCFVQANLPDSVQLEHIDGDFSNNSVSNLRIAKHENDLPNMMDILNKVVDELESAKNPPDIIAKNTNTTKQFVLDVYYKNIFYTQTKDKQFNEYGKKFNLESRFNPEELREMFKKEMSKSKIVKALVNKHHITKEFARYIVDQYYAELVNVIRGKTPDFSTADEHLFLDDFIVRLNDIDAIVEIYNAKYKLGKKKSLEKIHKRINKMKLEMK